VGVPLTSALRPLFLTAAIACAGATAARAQAVQRGTIVDPVATADDPAQTYALYLPSTYSHDRQWSLILAFHPAARGRQMVEKYQAAAERYGYIIAASNNSRNGPAGGSAQAAQAMIRDVGRRFSIDPRRLYLTGMSGGARVAMAIALTSNDVAGVIASSAGFPDSTPRASVPFCVFGTAGTEDFNYIEMRLLDRKLTTPHFLAVFQGGHMLPPDDVAFEAVEWLELQAMQSGRRGRDDALASAMLEKRRARIAASAAPAETFHLLSAVVADFKGVLDVSDEARRLDTMSRQDEVKKALKRERDTDEAEWRGLQEIFELEARLGQDEARDIALMTLRERLSKLARKAGAEADTPERSQARRVLRSITAGASGRVSDRQYLALLEQFRVPGR
jgi:pimeloyl-ACP methyl ester carboxylesterase